MSDQTHPGAPPRLPTDRMISLLQALPPGSLVVSLTEPGIVRTSSAPHSPVTAAVRAGAAFLPFGDSCADMVLISDSEATDPLSLLREVSRILRAAGIVAGLVRDPSHEVSIGDPRSTGFPPSQWIDALAELDFAAQLNFDASPSHLEFLAYRRAQGNSPLPVSNGAEVTTTGGLQASLRQGWTGQQIGWRMTGLDAAIYLLNELDRPVQVKTRLKLSHSADFSTLRIRFNSYVLADLYLSSEQLVHEVNLPEFLLPTGGHHLFFDLFPGGPRVDLQKAVLEARPAERQDLTEGLPFDLFQRYQLASRIAERLPIRTILDVGGYLGDRYGHLAFSGDFFTGHIQVTSTDLRACDHPRHQQADACSQPFSDRSFDLVLSMDVLEHLPPLRREPFLEELLRVSSQYIIVAAPFASPEVTRAEEQLLENLLSSRPFLQEHRELGLPEASWLEQFFSDRGCFLYRLPSGYLPRWTAAQVMANHYSQGGDYLLSRAFHRLYNRSFFPFDQLEPAYRTIFLISQERLSPQQVERIQELHSPSPPGSLDHLLASDPLFFEIHLRLAKEAETKGKALSDVQFLANARQEFIAILQRQRDETPLARLIWRRLRARGGKK
jgi:SAM-dependent methyltransferase